MKKFILTLLTAAVLIPSVALATIEKITTITGRTYRKCEIVKVHPDGVSFRHANGAAKVLFTDLPESWRSRLGYNPAKAAAYERELAQKRQQQAAARAAYQKEIARAMANAQELQLTRARIAEEHARAAVRAVELNNQYASAYPLMPPLGAVFDSRDYRFASRRGWDSRRWPHSYYGHGYYGNGVYYGLSSGYYHLNGQTLPPAFGVHPAPPVHIGFGARRGNFTLQVNP